MAATKILQRCASVMEYLLFMNRSNKRQKVVSVDEVNVDYKDWKALPFDMMEIILQYLDGTDRVCMSMVCKSWNLSLKLTNFRLPPQIPWLLLPHEEIPKTLSFYDLSQVKVHEIKFPRSLGTKWFCGGSSKGWLAMITDNFEIFLFNPLSGKRHQLPSLKTIRVFNSKGYGKIDFFGRRTAIIKNIQLSCEDPLKCTIAAIFHAGGVLASCRLKDKRWTVFDSSKGCDINQGYAILLFRKDMLYAITDEYNEHYNGSKIRARTFEIVLGDDNYNLILKLLPPIVRPREDAAVNLLFEDFRIDRSWRRTDYLIESNKSNGEILLVIKYADRHFHIKEEAPQGRAGIGHADGDGGGGGGEGEDEAGAGGNNDDDDSDDDDGNDEDVPTQEYYKTRRFEVFKLVPYEEDDDTDTTFSIQKVENLNEGTLFLSKGGSCSLGSLKEGRENCIYFADDNYYFFPHLSAFVSRESGIYNLHDGGIRRPFPSIPLPRMSTMSWFTPNFIL